MRIRSIKELRKLIEREKRRLSSYKYRIYVVSASCTHPEVTQGLLETLEASLEDIYIKDEVLVSPTGCLGVCSRGPIIRVEPGDYVYVHMTPEKARRVVYEHIIKGRPLKEYLDDNVTLFLRKQTRLVLRNVGKMNPERIEDYFAKNGYLALAKALTEMTPRQVIEEIKRSELVGRSGSAFPTGLKWEIVADMKDYPKYVIANLSEGDPGVFSNRALAEGDPHAIIEGMIIAGYAVGANKGFLYVRSDYKLALKRLRIAIEQARRYGLLGERILNSDFSFDIELISGVHEFIAGEETALISLIEGKRASPRRRPPYPATQGLWGKPTLVNNVETLANIPLIILKGAKWFAQFGIKGSKGTKVFSLVGHVKIPGLVEVPLGTKLYDIIYEVGGGIPNGHKLKYVQVGGPSGEIIPGDKLDLPIDHKLMGSGGIVVFDDRTCIVDIVKFLIEFFMEESCGYCIPCRVGLVRIYEILDRITRGQGSLKDLELLEKLCTVLRKACLCGLGRSAPIPVISTLRFFKDEYLMHIEKGICPAGKCPLNKSVNER